MHGGEGGAGGELPLQSYKQIAKQPKCLPQLLRYARVCVLVYECLYSCMCERNVQICLVVCLFAVLFLVNDSVLFIRHFNTFDANAGVGSVQRHRRNVTDTDTHTNKHTDRIHRNRIYFYLMRASHMRMLAVPVPV